MRPHQDAQHTPVAHGIHGIDVRAHIPSMKKETMHCTARAQLKDNVVDQVEVGIAMGPRQRLSEATRKQILINPPARETEESPARKAMTLWRGCAEPWEPLTAALNTAGSTDPLQTDHWGTHSR